MQIGKMTSLNQRTSPPGPSRSAHLPPSHSSSGAISNATPVLAVVLCKSMIKSCGVLLGLVEGIGWRDWLKGTYEHIWTQEKTNPATYRMPWNICLIIMHVERQVAYSSILFWDTMTILPSGFLKHGKQGNPWKQPILGLIGWWFNWKILGINRIPFEPPQKYGGKYASIR